MAIKLKNHLVIDIPNSEACIDSQLETIRDREVGSFYTDDNPSKHKLIKSFFDEFEKDFIIDSEKTNYYILNIREKMWGLKSLFKGKLNYQMEYPLLEKDIVIKPMKYTGKDDRYIAFDKEDLESQKFRKLLLGQVTNLYIVKTSNCFKIYPVLKENYDLALISKPSDKQFIVEKLPEISEEYKRKYGEDYLFYMILDNKNLFKRFEEEGDLDKIYKNTKINMGKDNSIKILEQMDLGLGINHSTPRSLKNVEKSKDSCNIEQFNPLKIDFSQNIDFEGLYFEDEKRLKQDISLALKSGKHIIFTGPPGTGKSKIAQRVANSYKAQTKVVTAMSNWSVYDTVGGYKPNDDGTLYFEEGIFLDSISKAGFDSQFKWLIIDEINRSDIDKSFGPFFSILSGDDVDIGFKKNNENIKILLENNLPESYIIKSNEYVVPKDWRLIGTMNTQDKTSLYDMSFAFMRRFAFIPINNPKSINASTLQKYLSLWGLRLSDEDIDIVVELWTRINNFISIGPAIIKDIVKFISLGGSYLSSLSMFVFPQMEGLFDDELLDVYESLKDCSFLPNDELFNIMKVFFDLKVD